jgi:molecular chaperone Hsp33
MALPDADYYAFDDVASRVRSLSDTAQQGTTLELLEQLAGRYRHETMMMQALRFQCTCSTDRVAAVMMHLSADELTEMIDDPGYGEVVCHFCAHAYRFEAEALRLMIEEQHPIAASPIGEA